MRRMIRWFMVALILIVSVSAGKPASAGCISDPNAALSYIDGQETCAYSGGGCSACFTGGRRGGGSWDLCYYDWNSGDLVCTYEN
jgi:hypothetical protein